MEEKMENFIKEYGTFKQFAVEQKITNNEPETIQLFAIFRKDERTNEIMERTNGSNKNGEAAATEKQKSYIRSIYTQKGMEFKEEDMDKLTKKEASRIINSLRAE